MSFFTGFTDELCKLAQGSALPKIAPVAPKIKPVTPKLPKPSVGKTGDDMKMQTFAPESAQAKAINAKAKTMKAPPSQYDVDRKAANDAYERNKKLQEEDDYR